ncbi:restriction endonuclease subunit S [Pseudoalteromonas sp. M8]|uniref:restriction endonuclease subunit S n=1 Tax=Pseudoalteromonas sp. M8 TaxID=2692624 RepID=UPI001BA50535|nr:restriction endonuclease subunit S [Pseudoalteromonas sp. M8]QUI68355.1 restriction endonuclease subunit S [Pseudoalteromonas sp. M8]
MAFNLTTLSEYAKVQGGFAYKSKDFIEYSENRVLKIKNVRFGTVSYEEPAYISDEIAQSTEAWATKEGDILISMTGSGPNAPQSLVGRVARVWANEPQSYINQRVGRIQLLEEGKVHPDFLFYLLSLPQSQDFLVSNSSGSANQANISGKIIGLLPCPEVTYEESESIANMVRSLDEKIILNRQTNQTLEQMAQVLFKSWFVDFDPVIDNALAAGNDIPDALKHKAEQRKQAQQLPDFKPLPDDIRALFPSEFEQTDDPSIGIAGWIPKGWKKDKLKSFGKVVTGKTPPKKVENAFDSEGTPFITPTDVDSDVYALNVARRLTEDGVKVVKNNVIEKGSVCVTCIGSQMGKTVITPTKAVTNQQLNSIILSDEFSRNYIFMNLRTRREELFNLGSSGSTMPILNKSSFESLSVIRPTDDILKSFSKLTENQIEKILVNSKQNKQLENIRDSLLPKLISGEVPLKSE